MQTFSDDQVRQLAKPGEIILIIRNAFARDFRATLRMPVRTQIELAGSILLLMPCFDEELHAAGVKIVSVSPKAGVNATYALLDAETGKALAVMEANYLTDQRTAATSAIATDLLARKDAKSLGVFGSGRQAVAHLTMLRHVRDFRQFFVCGSARSDLAAFGARMKTEHGLRIEVVDAQTCVRESDVLCTCTTSSEPLFKGEWLRTGTHLNLVGAFQPHTREVDDETVRRARVVVDTFEGSLAEAGDLLIPMNKGIVKAEHVIADLHQIVSGEKIGRTSADDITLFKSVGCALEDLVTAKLIFEKHKQIQFPILEIKNS
ncbi:MAG TPA: ornithine cyclodeaminase family protein [Candidatus Angelobacter sp.]|jgi:ornithine cyclodeaminase/alanine dehydrogenase-like protein (mu-crystallin family)|nr:ornithine cyclodeaminase family protein [Candidatus Angelobacter sp.]